MKIKKFINMYENSDQQSAFKIVELAKKIAKDEGTNKDDAFASAINQSKNASKEAKLLAREQYLETNEKFVSIYEKKIKKLNELYKDDLPYPLYSMSNYDYKNAESGIKMFISELVSANPDFVFDMKELKKVTNEYIDLLYEDGYFDQINR
jgi:hypothetical protein